MILRIVASGSIREIIILFKIGGSRPAVANEWNSVQNLYKIVIKIFI